MKINRKQNIYKSALIFFFLAIGIGCLHFLFYDFQQHNVLIFILSLFLLALFYIVMILYPLGKDRKSIKNFSKEGSDLNGLTDVLVNDSISSLLTVIQNNYTKKYRKDILNQQAEINYLQRQINPHFLYNTLESIRGNAISNGADVIAEMTEALAVFFRYSISQKGSMVTLGDELENVNNYFIIQRYRFDNRFSVKYIYDKKDIDLSAYFIPKLTIQPIIENAIYHGLESKVGKGEIIVRITLTGERLILSVIDNGTGMKKETLDSLNRVLRNDEKNSNFGIALYNVNKRIKLLFGDSFGLYVNSTINCGTEVQIEIPLIDSNNIREYKDNQTQVSYEK